MKRHLKTLIRTVEEQAKEIKNLREALNICQLERDAKRSTYSTQNEKKAWDMCEKLAGALNDMKFAYQNKDAECPHDFEVEAVKSSNVVLTEYQAMKERK